MHNHGGRFGGRFGMGYVGSDAKSTPKVHAQFWNHAKLSMCSKHTETSMKQAMLI